MLILLDCRPLQLSGSDSEKNHLIVSAIAALSASGAADWLFAIDQTYRAGVSPDLDDLLKNRPEGRVVTVRAFPGALGWRLWYDRQLPRLIKKHGPDVVMLTGGIAAKAEAVRQYLFMPGHTRRALSSVYTARLGTSLRQAETILCFSEKDRARLSGQGPINAANIIVVRPTPRGFLTPMEVGEKEQVKQRYTQGKEYFFTEASGAGEEQIVQLLKAFSLFKKRQLSNLRLLIAGKLTGALREKLETYKYREDVQWVETGDGDPRGSAAGAVDPGGVASGPAGPGEVDLMQAAYAILFPFADDSLGAPLLDAWKAGVPVLVASHSRLHEMAEDAALVAGETDPTAWAAHMMAVYKDETLRSALIQKGFSRLRAFDPPPATAALQMAIDNT